MSDTDRYARQRILPGFARGGQERLSASHAVIVGCGALGTHLAMWLARAGVGRADAGGRLTLIDRDVVELTNLHRQVLFTEADALDARPKAEAARTRLLAGDASLDVRALVADVRAANAERLVIGASPDAPKPDVILDASDNFALRYLLNDLAVKHDIPLVYAGVVGTSATTMTILPGSTPCLRCIEPTPPAPGSMPTCESAGVLGPVVGIVAGAQAVDAIKILTGNPEALSDSLLWFDAWQNQRRRLALGAPDPACPCCASRRFEFLDPAREERASSICATGSVQLLPDADADIDLATLATRLIGIAGARVVANDFAVRLSLPEPGERDGANLGVTLFRDGRAIIHGTTDVARARALFARYIGA